mmetsp:Transcript_58256/g.137108  ORF Transcript_58256/g.137108 Transcript_58256/m.137108 type:complete len:874 (+) Transcript_58256:26-2647(+)
MPSAPPVEKFRKDYKAPDYNVEQVALTFKLQESTTEVSAVLKVKRADAATDSSSFFLDGEDLVLNKISIDGAELDKGKYTWVQEDLLEIKGPLPASFSLETVVTINPKENFQLSGLYMSSGMYCTQCEAEGFRRITLMQDRPDVMATYKVRIEADKATAPILLSNGNLTNSGVLDSGLHFAEWEDPFPKPSYLFAVVAGDLGSIEDTFTTKSNRTVALKIFSEHRNVDQLDWAMASLKKAMKWDEEAFGLEYDLDVFHIVAVNDFNMGAMENKSLNVFNTSLILAKPSTATDGDYEAIQGVIGHEYFHNWTGNRVTCRDWFQLTLKEGLTVFRDQQFTRAMTSEIVKRINDVRVLRSIQFPEDSGPTAHPIRPESYIAMDNFYTPTVYRKGAEVIRMYHTLLGEQGFRKGMDLYFERHDGSAVTCDDFRAAMSDANGVNLDQFERWYTQAGTPKLNVKKEYDAGSKTLKITLEQSCKGTPGQDKKEPFHIPVRLGVLSAKSGKPLCAESLLELKEDKKTFEFADIAEEPVLSVLRGYSAPVKLEFDRSEEELAFLMGHDDDSFNRWEAGQTLFTRAILANVAAFQAGNKMGLSDALVEAVRLTLAGKDIEKSLQAMTLTLPSLKALAEELDVVDVDALVASDKFLRQSLAGSLKEELRKVYDANVLPKEPFRNDAEAVGMRRIKNTCLQYLAALKDEEAAELCLKQAKSAGCMTDLVAATNCLASFSTAARDEGIEHFYQQAKGNDLVLCKWFTLQALADTDDALKRVDKLLSHPDFNVKNPNKCRSVIRAFAENLEYFHAKDGSGYKWLADRIQEIDKFNPQVSSRMMGCFSSFRRFDEGRQALMKAQLERMLSTEGLSKDAFEIASKSIKG